MKRSKQTSKKGHWFWDAPFEEQAHYCARLSGQRESKYCVNGRPRRSPTKVPASPGPSPQIEGPYRLQRNFSDLTVSKRALYQLDDLFLDQSSSGVQGLMEKFGALVKGQNYFLKPRGPRAEENPEVELLMNQIAETLGVEVAEYGMAKVGTEKMFASKDFVRAPNSTATLKHFKRFLKDDKTWTVELVWDTLSELSEQAKEDKEKFVRLCLFDALVGNSDRHSRNLALIFDDGKFRLAPAYDNLSTMVASYLEYDLVREFKWRGKITTKKSKAPGFQDYVDEFKRLGAGKTVEAFLRSIKEKEALVAKLIDAAEIAFNRKRILKEYISKILRRVK